VPFKKLLAHSLISLSGVTHWLVNTSPADEKQEEGRTGATRKGRMRLGNVAALRWQTACSRKLVNSYRLSVDVAVTMCRRFALRTWPVAPSLQQTIGLDVGLYHSGVNSERKVYGYHHHHHQFNTHECSMNNKIHDKRHKNDTKRHNTDQTHLEKIKPKAVLKTRSIS